MAKFKKHVRKDGTVVWRKPAPKVTVVPDAAKEEFAENLQAAAKSEEDEKSAPAEDKGKAEKPAEEPKKNARAKK